MNRSCPLGRSRRNTRWTFTYNCYKRGMLSDMRLPILDLSRLDRGEDEAEAFRTELREATHEYGFFYLTGHGVPQELLNEAIATARDFFALPVEDKLSIENVKSPHFRGYTRI